MLFNFVYLILSISSHLIGKKPGLDFFRDLTDSRTYLYIIASSIILAALVSSLVFYKVKTERFKYGDNYDFDDKIEELLLDDAEKKDKIEKVTISLGHNGLMIMQNGNAIEIPVLPCNAGNQESKAVGSSPFKEVTFVEPSSFSNKNKSIYPGVVGSKEVRNVIEKINKSKIFFFKKTDFEKYYHRNYPNNVRYQCGTMYISNGKTQKPADKIFKFTDLYNINSIKIHYEDCSSTEVKLKLKEEQAIDMELCEYMNANRPNPLGNIKQPQIAFIPAIAGNRPIFSGRVL